MSNEKFEGKSFVNLRLLKKIGIVGLSVSLAVIVLVAVFSLLQSSGKSFSIRIDNPVEVPNLRMSSTVNGQDQTTYYSGEPLTNASQAMGKKVYERVNGIDDLNKLHGSQNLTHIDLETGKEVEGSQDAQVYTMYLSSDGDESEEFQVALMIDGLDTPFGVTSLLEYYRAMFIISDVTESLEAHKNQQVFVYGSKNTKEQGTIDGSEDYRECISSYTLVPDASGKSVRKADEDSRIEEISYCEPFFSKNVNEDLVRFTITIPSKSMVRLTYVGYFEGFDPDAYGAAPTEAYMLLSLHFGKQVEND